MSGPPGRWIYRWILRALPPGFRHDHGAEMEDVFFDALDTHRRRGVLPWLLAWVLGAADVMEQAFRLRASSDASHPEPHWRRGMDTIRQDLKLAIRSLARTPGFALVAVATLALGIGANTAIFSLVNAILLKTPEHVTNPEELVSIWTSDFSGPRYGTSSYPDFESYRSVSALADVAAVSPGVVNQAGQGGVSQILLAEFVSGGYFDLLGVQPALGRWFTAEESDWASGTAVAVVSHGMWIRGFGGDPGVLGSTVRLSGQQVTIVGVAPDGFAGTLPVVTPDYWLPVSTQALIQGEGPFQQRGSRSYLLRGRLAPDASVATAQAQLDALAGQLLAEYPGQWSDVNDEGRKITVEPTTQLPPQMQGAASGFAALLLGVVGVVLLIACANVANLTLARASRRNRELAIRLSLGASRGRVTRQLLTESALLGVLGGLGGATLAVVTTRLASSWRPGTGIAFSLDLGTDVTVLAFSAAATLVTVLAVGLLPALKASRPDLVASLKEGTESGSARFRWFQLRHLLVIVQVSASLVLLVGAGLFLKSLKSAVALDTGYRSEGLATVSLDLGPEGYGTEEATQFFERLQTRVAGLPGVQAVALVDALPLTAMAGQRRSVSVVGYEPRPGEDMEFQYLRAGPGFFSSMGTPISAGREFSTEDHAGGPLVALVNETFAQRFWPEQDPLGRRLAMGRGDVFLVVGWVADASYRQLGEAPRPAFFLPLAQSPTRRATLVARTSPDRAGDLLTALRAEVAGLDAQLPLLSLRTMSEAIASTLLPQRAASWLLSGAGVLGLVLAAVGLYGVMAFLVAQRTREVGVRMALGAQAGDVVRMVVRRGLALAGIGAVLGLAIAAGVTRFLRSLLFGVSPLDLSVFGVMGLAAVLVAGLASYVPARRAASVDPARTLRED